MSLLAGPRTGVAEYLEFELNHKIDTKFLEFAKFHRSQYQSGKNLKFESNIECYSKFLVWKIPLIVCKTPVAENL